MTRAGVEMQHGITASVDVQRSAYSQQSMPVHSPSSRSNAPLLQQQQEEENKDNSDSEQLFDDKHAAAQQKRDTAKGDLHGVAQFQHDGDGGYGAVPMVEPGSNVESGIAALLQQGSSLNFAASPEVHSALILKSLEALSIMGYTDYKQNMEALNATGGDLQLTVQYLKNGAVTAPGPAYAVGAGGAVEYADEGGEGN